MNEAIREDREKKNKVFFCIFLGACAVMKKKEKITLILFASSRYGPHTPVAGGQGFEVSEFGKQ